MTIGDAKNSFLGNLYLAHVQLQTAYTLYLDENILDATSIKCNTDCQISLNTFSYSQCLMCINGKLLDNGLCVTACVDGKTALKNTDINVCKNCDFKCSTCQTVSGDCDSCNKGYYLKVDGITCDTSANCDTNYVGDPATLTCSKCGNAKRDAGEGCDDGNFVANDGCTNCVVDANYVCAGNTPDVCQLRCGDGVVDAGFGEVCDDNNS